MAFGQFNFRPEGRFVRIRCDETTSRKAFEGMPEVEEAEGDGAEDGHGRGDEWRDELTRFLQSHSSQWCQQTSWIQEREKERESIDTAE